MKGCASVVLLLVAAFVAIPSQAAPVSHKEQNNGQQVLLQAVPFDTRICEPDVSKTVYDAMYSDVGKAAQCPECLEIALHFEESNFTTVPAKEAACECTRAISPLLPFIKNAEYDCVLTLGLWNVAQLAKECSVAEVETSEADALSSNATEVVSEVTCKENVTCIHGECVDDKCICRRGAGDLTWGPDHPLFVGEDCTIPWCKDDCSGHGSCMHDTGLCMCDTNYVGLACDMVHNPTHIAEGHGGVMAVEEPYAGEGPCLKALYALPLARAPTVDTPQCDKNGEWLPVQCNAFTERCWCVDTTGKELAGSSRTNAHPPSEFECKSFLIDKGTYKGLGKDLAQRVESDDPCRNTFCSGNGYCNPTEKPAKCHCVGKWTGETCAIPPSD